MLGTRVERIVRWIGFAVLAGLLAVTVLAWRDYNASPTRESRSAVRAGAATSGAKSPAPSAPAASRRTRALDRLALRAVRGDCWLEVRRGGKLLFAGILAQGAQRAFSGRRLELTLGAPSNVDATLNGRSVKLPAASSTGVLSAGRLVFAPIS